MIISGYSLVLVCNTCEFYNSIYVYIYFLSEKRFFGYPYVTANFKEFFLTFAWFFVQKSFYTFYDDDVSRSYSFSSK